MQAFEERFASDVILDNALDTSTTPEASLKDSSSEDRNMC
jgi:hypothetical protein